MVKMNLEFQELAVILGTVAVTGYLIYRFIKYGMTDCD